MIGSAGGRVRPASGNGPIIKQLVVHAKMTRVTDGSVARNDRLAPILAPMTVQDIDRKLFWAPGAFR